MADPAPDPARARFMMIQLVRLGGLLLILGGMVIVADKLPAPPLLGYGLLVLGMFEFFVLPLMLAKRWRSPRE